VDSEKVIGRHQVPARAGYDADADDTKNDDPPMAKKLKSNGDHCNRDKLTRDLWIVRKSLEDITSQLQDCEEITQDWRISLMKERPVKLSGKNATLVDAWVIIMADLIDADDVWKQTAPKKVVSR